MTETMSVSVCEQHETIRERGRERERERERERTLDSHIVFNVSLSLSLLLQMFCWIYVAFLNIYCLDKKSY